MPKIQIPSLHARQNYIRVNRRKNYIASMKLEGFDVDDIDKSPARTKTQIIAYYQAKARS